MKELVKYLIIAIIAGGAIPIIFSYLTKKNKRKNKHDNSAQ